MLSAVAKGTTAWKADLIAGANLMNSDMVKLAMSDGELPTWTTFSEREGHT